MDTLNLPLLHRCFAIAGRGERNFNNAGKNDIRTKELQTQMQLYRSFRRPFMDLYKHLNGNGNKLTTEKKYQLINDLFNRNVQAVFDSSQFFSKNINYSITSLYFMYSGVLWSQGLIPQYKLKLALDTTRTYTAFDILGSSSNYTQLNEDWFWNVPEYREFIYNYIRFYKPFNNSRGNTANNEERFNPTLDEYYLAQSSISFTNIKDWFITESIMDGFGFYSFADVENVYKQFMSTCKTPYLKDTLQKYYTTIKRLKPGNPAPGFSLKNEKGQIVSLSNFRGKVVYIDFWGVGCGPCIYL